jgi:acid phosphatase family membrane protein YuiD
MRCLRGQLHVLLTAGEVDKAWSASVVALWQGAALALALEAALAVLAVVYVLYVRV